MSKLIAICDGHGMETPGKRTPLFPDGSFMHENDFNRAVAEILDKHLLRCGFCTLMVAPDDTDTFSIHANAMGDTWGDANGIETYQYIKVDPTKRNTYDSSIS